MEYILIQEGISRKGATAQREILCAPYVPILLCGAKKFCRRKDL